jgi:hypothetical protein
MCECMKKMNEHLAQHNGRLATGIQITESMGLKERHLLATEKIDKAKRSPVPSVMCSYCPFCGEKLD